MDNFYNKLKGFIIRPLISDPKCRNCCVSQTRRTHIFWQLIKIILNNSKSIEDTLVILLFFKINCIFLSCIYVESIFSIKLSSEIVLSSNRVLFFMTKICKNWQSHVFLVLKDDSNWNWKLWITTNMVSFLIQLLNTINRK